MQRVTKLNGELSTNDNETANTMNTFFSSVFSSDNNCDPPPLAEKVYPQTLNSIEITEEKVAKAIRATNPNKAPGPDNLHPKFIVETRDSITKPLSVIFNKSIDESTLPTSWKMTNRIIRNEIVAHMEDNQLFSNDQHGFRQGKSCTTQLLETMEIWYSSLDEGHNVDVIYMDFSKASIRSAIDYLLQVGKIWDSW
ncbi:uncharacterized protein [Argopecten irradians]|uniref:uncharacterized protein n=1 Tax=Argopecten irradians TaxID=31199 RepID=UPI0037201604